jgi:hypothetical protein
MPGNRISGWGAKGETYRGPSPTVTPVIQTPRTTPGYLLFGCDDDDCDVTAIVPIPSGRWERAERAAERAGWQTIPVPAGWLHYCPNCKTAA